MAVDTFTTLRDSNNNIISVKTRRYDDGTVAFYHAFDSIKKPVVSTNGTTIANTSKLIAPTNTVRVGLTFQNKSSSSDMYVSEDGNPANLNNGWRIPPGVTAEVESAANIYVFCAQNGQPYIVSERYYT